MKAEQDATVARLKAGWPIGRVYNVGAVPSSPVTPYQDVAVAPGTPVQYRAGSRTQARSFRAVVRTFGKTFGEVALGAEAADASMIDERIAEGYSPCRAEVATSVIRDPDGGGLLMAVRTYTFNKHA